MKMASRARHEVPERRKTPSMTAQWLAADQLKNRGDGGNYGGMEPATREYVDLKVENAVVRLEGKIDALSGRLDSLATRRDTWGAALSAGLGLFVALLAVLAFAGDRFDSGLGLADKQQEQLEQDRRQNDRIEAILNRLDAQSALPATPAVPSGTTSGN